MFLFCDTPDTDVIVWLHGNCVILNVRCDHPFVLELQNIDHRSLTYVQIVCLHGNSMKLNVRCDHSFFLELQNIDHKSYITEMLYLVFWTIYQWTKKNINVQTRKIYK